MTEAKYYIQIEPSNNWKQQKWRLTWLHCKCKYAITTIINAHQLMCVVPLTPVLEFSVTVAL